MAFADLHEIAEMFGALSVPECTGLYVHDLDARRAYNRDYMRSQRSLPAMREELRAQAREHMRRLRADPEYKERERAREREREAKVRQSRRAR